MDQTLFTSGLQAWNGEIQNQALQETIEQLKELIGPHPLRILEWESGSIAVPLDVAVDLPPLGTVGGIDIRREEPVVIVFSLKGYPQDAPRVHTDRQDLPAKILPHMYLPVEGKPPGFCLVKGGSGAINEWYANKRIKDVVIRVANWLRDAASGVLSLDGEHFDPLRIVSYGGSVQYDYDVLAQIVRNKQSLYPGGNVARLQLELKLKDQEDSYFKVLKAVTADQLKEAEDQEKNEAKKDASDTTRKKLYRALLLWSDSDQPVDVYDVDLPRTWDDFKNHFCGKHLLEPGTLEQELIRHDGYSYLLNILIVAIKRPLLVLGFTDSIEFLHFSIFLEQKYIQNGAVVPEAPLKIYNHIQPLSLQKARQISGGNVANGGLTLVAGAGALGSKVVLHLIKSGYQGLVVADGDRLEPHNFVRHGLNAVYLHHNKAAAMWIESQFMYPDVEKVVEPKGQQAGPLLLSDKAEQVYERVFDFTAATPFFHELVRANLAVGPQVVRGYISDAGNLGLLMVEGNGRNPRIDDLQAMTYQQGIKDARIRDWLYRENADADQPKVITVGVGCNTDTTVLSDEVVSLHAAVMTGQLKREIGPNAFPGGSVIVNQVSYEPFFRNEVELLQFRPFSIFQAENKSGWEVRFAPDIIDNLVAQMHRASPNETGGVLIGCANYKTKTIHVTDLIDAPPDSKANAVCFFRGKQGLPEAVQRVTESTGGQLGYIGEWHSHPQGPEGPSRTDLRTVLSIKHAYANEVAPLPVFLLIITAKKVLPYVF